MASALPLPAADLIPQASPMRQIDSLDAWDNGSARGIATVSDASLFADASGRVGAPALVEMMAQLAAAGQGYEMRLGGRPPRSGLLVGLKAIDFSGVARVGDALIVETERTFQMDEASMVEGQVRRGDELLAKGTLKVWEQDEAPACPDGTVQKIRNDAVSGLPDDDPRGEFAEQSPIRGGIARSIVEWSSGSGEEARARFAFDAGFPGFAGHFPEVPILPAVCMVEMARAVVELALGRILILRSVSQAKFSRLVFPGNPVDCEAKIESGANEIAASVRLSSDGQPVARIHLALGEDAT